MLRQKNLSVSGNRWYFISMRTLISIEKREILYFTTTDDMMTIDNGHIIQTVEKGLTTKLNLHHLEMGRIFSQMTKSYRLSFTSLPHSQGTLPHFPSHKISLVLRTHKAVGLSIIPQSSRFAHNCLLTFTLLNWALNTGEKGYNEMNGKKKSDMRAFVTSVRWKPC